MGDVFPWNTGQLWMRSSDKGRDLINSSSCHGEASSLRDNIIKTIVLLPKCPYTHTHTHTGSPV